MTRAAAIAAAVATGASIAAGLWWVRLRPQSAASQRRYETFMDVLKLYDLQVAHKKVKGIYAGNLESLLVLSPDPAALKARLSAHADINTLTVVGNAERFKIEANVLDPQRTLIKIKGPAEKR